MSLFTDFLNLFKWDIQTDEEEEFDIDKALNDNWDKIDAKFKDLSLKQSTNANGIDVHIKNTQNPHKITKEQLGLGNALLNNSDVKDNIVTFTENTDRSNIESGNTLSSIFGKIKKYFRDLKSVAFTGSYNDLIDKPNISNATQSTDGLMSSNDKKKLDGVAIGAQVNVIESVKVNGVLQTVNNKGIDIKEPGWTDLKLASRSNSFVWRIRRIQRHSIQKNRKSCVCKRFSIIYTQRD